MRTSLTKATPAAIRRAAAALRDGQLVAFPTETVYGLGASALSGAAVKRIFAAKGRPSDNPVLVHVSDEAMLKTVVSTISPKARALMEQFWPGPLTIIFPAHKRLPKAVTAGLPTVAVRMPQNKTALALIREAGVPVAAPSANLSGRPSPTTARHVLSDMRGRIPLVLDGGPCRFGVESTIVDISRSPAVVLRPGAVPLEAVQQALGWVVLATDKSKVRAPGMKYRHYAPRAVLVLVRGDIGKIRAEYTAKKVKVFRAAELTTKNLYAKLREADDHGYEVLLAPAVPERGDGLTLMNRLRKAASRII